MSFDIMVNETVDSIVCNLSMKDYYGDIGYEFIDEAVLTAIDEVGSYDIGKIDSYIREYLI